MSEMSPSPYQHWLVVASSKRHFPDIGTAAQSLWCLRKQAMTGHDFLFYRTRTGIVALWKITGASRQQPECARRSMHAFEGRRVKAFKNPLTYADMLGIPALKEMWGLRGRFQGVCFGIKDAEYETILSALSAKNSA